MLPPDALDLRGAADELGVTYDWLQRTWRGVPGFPPPYLGGGKGQRPRWALQAIRDFKAGRRWAAAGGLPPVPASADRPVANDTQAIPVTDRVAALLAAAGG